MANQKFKIGDKVKALGNSGRAGIGYLHAMKKYCGDISEITSFRFYGNNSVCYCLKNIPYEWDESLLEAVKNENKIVITTNGTTTRAVLYDGHKLIREAKSICSKDDTFDFEAGAKIAFERLTAKPAVKAKPKKELKPLNTKVFVIDGYNEFKSGHIYEIKGGKIIDDTGWKYPYEGSFYDMNDVHEYFSGNNNVKYNSIGEKTSGYSTMKQVKVMEVKEW